MQLEADEPTDVILMERVARGDHAAFGCLVAKHQNSAFKLAIRYLGNRADAEEIVQESFVRLFKAAPRYRPEAPFRSYFLTITTRLCLNRKARLATSREVPTGGEVLEGLSNRSTGGGPEDELLHRERRLAVREAVMALPDEQRMALLLFRFEELSYREIAEVMGKSDSAITALLWRARERLRVALRDLVEETTTDHMIPRPHRL